MLTKTSEAGVQALIYLARCGAQDPVSPRVVADKLGLSPTYLAKITGMLVKSGVLIAHRGVKGGVTLAREPERISLLDIVQSLQGMIIGHYCELASHHTVPGCAFHDAMVEIHEATTRVLSKWSLKDLADEPFSSKAIETHTPCRMECLRQAVPEDAG